MHRRDLLARLAAGGAGALMARATAAAPLRRITVALLDEPAAAASGACGQDYCTSRDACLSGDAGHTCQQRDVCAIDESGNCTRDECTQTDASNKGASCTDDRCDSDASAACTGDTCTSDSSGSCAGDTCTADSSGTCATDACESDKSGGCTADMCTSDKSGWCSHDECVSDSSKECQVADACTSDSSGECATDSCRSDASGACAPADACVADSSGACATDNGVSDSSGECSANDWCVSDSSGGCSDDECVSDKSGGCGDDECVSDKSGGCTAHDTCVSDSSKECGDDGCTSDASFFCERDACGSDSSAECTQTDVCVFDSSGGCVSDLCRRDTSPPCTTDSCAPDLHAFSTRRSFTRLGRALRWLYEIGAVVLLWLAAAPPAAGQDAINIGCAATFYPRVVTLTGTPVSLGTPKGPFLADFDGDGVLEADVNGNGFDAADPELADRDGDGTRELPPGTAFAGNRTYTVFWVPDDAVIAATGFLNLKLATDARVFGALRLAAGAEVAARGVIDVRGSAWLAETGGVKLSSALAGNVASNTCDGLDDTGADFLGPVIDTDLDGALDADEGTGDGDGDGVPDWQDQDTATLPSPNGAGAVAADVAEGAGQRLDFTLARALAETDPSLPASGRPAPGRFPFGVREVHVAGLTSGETITLTLHLPVAAAAGSQYWRVYGNAWHAATLGDDDGDAVVTFTLTDGGPADRDGVVNGRVAELGGVFFIPRPPSRPVRRQVGH